MRIAAEAAAGQQYPAPALYVVATPIGNIADLTPRALHVLALADAVACEDTRHSAALLSRLGLGGKPLFAAHAHNERAAGEALLVRLARGERVACISDAGTPGIRDPGARLVAAAVAADHRVVPVPGPSSLTAAVSVAGDAAAESFRFAGFLPAGGQKRQHAIDQLTQGDEAQVLLEAPHRIEALLQALADRTPERRVTVARELTKQFEAVATLTARDAPAWLAADANRSRGEFVVVLHAAPPVAHDGALDAEPLRVLALLRDALPLKTAVALTAAITGAPRNALYDAGLALGQPGTDDEAARSADG